MGSTIVQGSGSAKATIKGSGTFTGDVYIDPAMMIKDSPTAIANVTFLPCARSYWHTHEGGQVLHVLQGSGWICDKGEAPRVIKAGDVIYAAPGTTHWHGAAEGSIMSHMAISMGACIWREEVSDEEYKKAGK